MVNVNKIFNLFDNIWKKKYVEIALYHMHSRMIEVNQCFRNIPIGAQAYEVHQK